MKRSFLALSALLVLFAGLIGVSFAGAGGERVNNQTANLAAQLPASDGVIMLNVQRLINTALPQFLIGGKAPLLTEMNAKADEIKTQTGIDLRQFESIAVGVMLKPDAQNKVDYAPLVLARGAANSNSLLATAKTWSKSRYREEKSGTRTIYVFAAREIVQANKPNAKTPKDEENFGKMLARVPSEIAVAAFDDNTLAIGSLTRVRETIEGRSRVGQDVLALANRQPNVVMSFGANTAQGLAPFIKLDNDEIGKNLEAIRQMRGSMDVNGANTVINVAAKSTSADTAKNLEDMLAGLQMIGKGFLSGMKGNDKEIYGRMLDNAKIARVADEVTIDVKASNADINALIDKK